MFHFFYNDINIVERNQEVFRSAILKLFPKMEKLVTMKKNYFTFLKLNFKNKLLL